MQSKSETQTCTKPAARMLPPSWMRAYVSSDNILSPRGRSLLAETAAAPTPASSERRWRRHRRGLRHRSRREPCTLRFWNVLDGSRDQPPGGRPRSLNAPPRLSTFVSISTREGTTPELIDDARQVGGGKGGGQSPRWLATTDLNEHGRCFQRWEGGKVERWKGGKVERWEGGKVGRWKGEGRGGKVGQVERWICGSATSVWEGGKVG